MSKILKNFDRYVKKLEKAAEKTFIDFEKSVKPEIMQMTPKDTGALRESYDFGRVGSDPFKVDYVFSFGAGVVGDDGLPYAGMVHEWESENINWTTEGTGAGYLLIPVSSHQNDIKSIYRLNVKGIRL